MPESLVLLAAEELAAGAAVETGIAAGGVYAGEVGAAAAVAGGGTAGIGAAIVKGVASAVASLAFPAVGKRRSNDVNS